MLRFLSFLWEKKKDCATRPEADIFREKYGYFRRVLLKNNEALDLLTDLEQLVHDSRSFTLDEFIGKAERLISLIYEQAEYLNGQTRGKYSELFELTENLAIQILSDLVKKSEVRKSHLLLPLHSLSLDRLSEVGGKAANLGEVANRVNLSTPHGFALSAYASRHFLTENGLWDDLEAAMSNLDIYDTKLLHRQCRDIQAKIMEARVPSDISRAIHMQAAALKAELGPDLRFSVRSSAVCEDSAASFAGQYSSVLNVCEEDLEAAYKEVAASTYSPRAVFYARSRGYSHEDISMAVLFVAMIESKASGVAYTTDPNDPESKNIVIGAAWGLGVSVVDGASETDEYRVSRKDRTILSRDIAVKETLQASAAGMGLEMRRVPDELQKTPCLTEASILQLSDCAISLEKHYGFPVDIEWAIDDEDRLHILQVRPLNPQAAAESRHEDCISVVDLFPLLQGGATASRGAAAGKAYLLDSEHALLDVPDGAILVARTTSPSYVPIFYRLAAIVTDIGAVTGHMASVAREFCIPALVGLHRATRTIRHGQEITVDSTNRIIYSGLVDEVVQNQPRVCLMKGSPTLLAAQQALRLISPLNLVDPGNENFTPEGCESLHDLIRFIHEISMRDMFKISDLDEAGHDAILMKVKLPLRIFVVDLGCGLRADHGTGAVSPEDVASIPFLAVLRGMTNEKVRWMGGVAFSFKGFASIMAESMFHDPTVEGRIGGPSYAIIADEYLNFSIRLGYHFATVEAFCGQAIGSNYIRFFFKGGAADIARRSRRASLIGAILRRLDFLVETRGDMVRAELKDRRPERIQDRLDQIGRLMGAVRLLDMVLADDGHVSWYVEEFFKENYSFQR